MDIIEYGDALNQAIEYFGGLKMEAQIFLDKYALKDNEDNLYEATPDHMHSRIAKEINRIENKYSNPRSYEEILDSITDFKYNIPQGSPMAGIGNPFQIISLSNCFVIHNTSDSYGGIMRIDEQLTHLMKRRGGVGTDISHLRPESSPVKNSARTSTGAVSFMERYSNTTREVAQSGRRGALMITISGLHPDVEQFIDIKMDETKVTGANISIRQYDEFLEAVDRGDTEFTLRFPTNKPVEEAKVTKVVNPQEVWDKIVNNAWERAEPGLLFWDTIINNSLPDCYADLGFKTVSTNPCFRGDMKILTTNGYEPFKNLSDGESTFINHKGEGVKGSVWSNGYKDVFEMSLSVGDNIFCTEDHIFMNTQGDEKTAREIVGDRIMPYYEHKAKSPSDLPLTKAPLVRSLNFVGKEEVFDFNLQDNTHWGIVEGVVAHNCGEITLCDGDSCRLMALNLYSFVVNPFTEDSYFDWDKFEEQVILGQRMMDDIVDLEIEAVDRIINKIKNDPEPEEIKWVEIKLWEKIIKKAKEGRRTGNGITAMGDMLASLGYIYGSEDSTDFAEKVMMKKKHHEYSSSITLGKERGTFPIYDRQRELNNPFLLRIKEDNPELYIRLQKSGRRNIALSTIAPTGSSSLLAQTTSGIENLFSPFYFRSKKVNPNDSNVRIDYTDEVGDSWQEYPVFHPTFKTFLRINGLSDEQIIALTQEEANVWVEKSPYHGATAKDVNWVNKVKMQGRIQKHIDHSISVTVNLPEDIKRETVKNVYMEAWKSGCKGITVYRDNSRTGVLNTRSKKDGEDTIIHNDAPKRPKSLSCDVYHTTTKGERWTVFVGKLKDAPYEVFAVKGEYGHHKGTGTIEKIKSGTYNFVNGDITENITQYNSDEESALTRVISTALRHGAQIKFVVEQLNKSEGSIISFGKAIARQLKKYVGDTHVDVDKIAKASPLSCIDEEGECHIEYTEGCLVCRTHGTSKCT